MDLKRNDPDPRLRLHGRVTSINEAITSLLVGALVREHGSVTRYLGRDEQEISRSKFYSQVATGASLQALGDNFTDANLPADRLSLEEDEN